MKTNIKYVIPSLFAIVVAASAALAQTPPAAQGPQRGMMNRTSPTAEQMAARQTQMCADMQAREIGRFAYLEARLNLTAAQKPLFESWKAAAQSQDATRQANCTKPRPAPGAARPTLPERNARMEDMLKTRLASLEKIRPSQEALYNALMPDQQKLFEQGGRGGRGMNRGFGGRGRGGSGGRGFGGPGRRGGM